MARSRSAAAARGRLFRSQLEVNLDSEGQLLIKAGPLFARELRKVLRDIEDTARRYVGATHSKTGRLRRSIHAQRVKRMAGGRRITGSVKAGSRLAPYARHVHEGTRPHIIRAKKAKALSFHGKYTVRTRYVPETVSVRNVASGRTITSPTGRLLTRRSIGPPGRVTVAKVNHPGYEGDPFLIKSARVVVLRHGGRVNLPLRN